MKINNIFLIGPMGAGKSTIGRALAKELKLNFFDSDEEIEERTGTDIAWIFDIEGEAGFRKREQKVIDDLTKKQSILLATGGGAVETPQNRTALTARGTVIYLRTSLEHQYDRTRRDAKRPLLHTEDVRGKIDELWASREPHYSSMADYIFDTDKDSVRSITNEIVKRLTDID